LQGLWVISLEVLFARSESICRDFLPV
jgi:hypothetical protein